MASNLGTANLTITIEEDILLNGLQQGNKTTQTIPAVAEIYKRVMTIPANDGDTDESDNEVVILGTTGDDSTTVGPGNFIVGDIKYFRITNLNTGSNEGVVLQISRDDAGDATDEETAWFLLEEGRSFIIHTFANGFDANDGALADYILDDITELRVVAETAAAVDIEIFVACT